MSILREVVQETAVRFRRMGRTIRKLEKENPEAAEGATNRFLEEIIAEDNVKILQQIIFDMALVSEEDMNKRRNK